MGRDNTGWDFLTFFLTGPGSPVQVRMAGKARSPGVEDPQVPWRDQNLAGTCGAVAGSPLAYRPAGNNALAVPRDGAGTASPCEAGTGGR